MYTSFPLMSGLL